MKSTKPINVNYLRVSFWRAFDDKIDVIDSLDDTIETSIG